MADGPPGTARLVQWGPNRPSDVRVHAVSREPERPQRPVSEDEHNMPSGSRNSGPKSGSAKATPAKGATAAKSAKALRAAKSRSGGTRKGAGASVVTARQIPWITIAAAVAVLALIGGITAYLVPRYQVRAETQRFVPSASNPDPSTGINGVVSVTYKPGSHVTATQRVAYDQNPPFGGPHDQIWATCTGIVYPNALRNENAVHSLEHGAVWVTYNPDQLSADQVSTLANQVRNKPFMFMSPYPGLSNPISLQGWGRQLKVDSVTDQRITEFITAVRGNSAIQPEPGATCDTQSPQLFDPTNPPPADVGAAGAGAIPMDGAGATQVNPSAEPVPTAPPATPAPASPAVPAPAPANPAVPAPAPTSGG